MRVAGPVLHDSSNRKHAPAKSDLTPSEASLHTEVDKAEHVEMCSRAQVCHFVIPVSKFSPMMLDRSCKHGQPIIIVCKTKRNV